MSQLEKKLTKWRVRRPQYANKDEVFAVLNRYGFEITQRHGSHVSLFHPTLLKYDEYGKDGNFRITVTSGQRIKHYSLQIILKAIDQVRG